MSNLTRKVLEPLHVWVDSDTPFRRRARLAQARWREQQGYAEGWGHGKPRGDRLAMPWAQESLANYLTPAIRGLVTEELSRAKTEGKLYSAPRIYDSLLSSQPLCFNLFGELALRLDLATEVFRRRIPDLERVTHVRFEHSPGRGDAGFLHDNTAFDALVEYTLRAGGRGFVGIEVKYSEDVRDKPAAMRPRYLEVAQQMGCFDMDALGAVTETHLQQLWRDHLLAGVLQLSGEFSEGLAVVVYPRGNEECAAACAAYRGALREGARWDAWCLEDLVADMAACVAEAWVGAVGERYLAEGGADAVLGGVRGVVAPGQFGTPPSRVAASVDTLPLVRS